VSAGVKPRVDVWTVELAGDAGCIETCFDYLSPDERARAAEYRFESLKTAFALTRGVLRALLARYLSVQPARIRFAPGPRGKPRITYPQTSLEFNVTHSGKLAAYAFAFGCEVGIDIEAIRPISDMAGLVQRLFSPEEITDWLGLEPTEREAAFFHCWTRKEAYIKAIGDGLSMRLDSFRVSLTPGDEPRLIYARGEPSASRTWSLHSVEPAHGYAGAIAVPDPARGVHMHPLLTAADVLERVGKPAVGAQGPTI
jgi:4'-phosphopantetheinyl transferase